MEVVDFFVCDGCQNRDFKRVYNFSLRFHTVNFSDELIYDKIVDEWYQCTQCQKTFHIKEIEEALTRIKNSRKNAV
jgi:hypothetical protein